MSNSDINTISPGCQKYLIKQFVMNNSSMLVTSYRGERVLKRGFVTFFSEILRELQSLGSDLTCWQQVRNTVFASNILCSSADGCVVCGICTKNQIRRNNGPMPFSRSYELLYEYPTFGLEWDQVYTTCSKECFLIYQKMSTRRRHKNCQEIKLLASCNCHEESFCYLKKSNDQLLYDEFRGRMIVINPSPEKRKCMTTKRGCSTPRNSPIKNRLKRTRRLTEGDKENDFNDNNIILTSEADELEVPRCSSNKKIHF